MTWQDNAACKGIDPALFFAEGQSEETKQLVKKAREACAECPVRTECLEAGMFEDFGVWGGLSVEERRLFRRQRNVARPLPPINCGTAPGYDTHRRRGEEPCDACRAAHAVAVRERKQRSRERTEAA